MTKTRFLYIDIARVIAMLWIVGWWHLIQYSKVGEDSYHFIGDNSITMLMLGLFMFLSGFLIGKKSLKTKEEIKSFYKSRFWRFYILYALSVITFPILTGFNREISIIITTLTATSPYILPQPVTLWFLSMLAGFYLITPLVKRNIAIGGGILIIFVLLHILLPEGIDTRVFVYFPLYVFGLFSSEYSFIDKITQKKIVIPVSLILSLLLYMGAIYYEWFVYLFIPTGIIFVLSISRLLEYININKFISVLSYSSLCVYLFHRQIYQIVYGVLRRIGFNDLFVLLLVALPLCICFSWFIQKIYDSLLKRFKII